MSEITLTNVRTNNLKGVDITIPVGGLTVICGVSGSGKSSLAYDTLFAAGQRRFLSTLSTAAQELLGRLPVPEAEKAENVPPAIALRQEEPPFGPLETVATAVGLQPLTSALFARYGQWRCPACERTLARASAETIAEYTQTFIDGTRLLVAFPADHLGSDRQQQLSLMSDAGLTRFCLNGQIQRFDEFTDAPSNHIAGDLFGIIDRVTVGKTSHERIRESSATAFRAGSNSAVVLTENGHHWSPRWFSKALSCECGYATNETLSEHHLTHMSPLGVCRSCQGTGTNAERNSRDIEGCCDDCEGSRLNEWSGRSRLDKTTFREISTRPIADWPTLSAFAACDNPQGRELVAAIERRRKSLAGLGLGHLQMSRSMASLSSGEQLRARLAGVIANETVDTLFVLDEPTASLHPVDIPSVVDTIANLVDEGNTVVAVEHGRALLDRADRVIEVGPAAGREGGEIVFSGTVADFCARKTMTAELLCEARAVEPSSQPHEARIVFRDLARRKLQIPLVEIPGNRLTIVSGRSGAGKTTLLEAIEVAALADTQGQHSSCTANTEFDVAYVRTKNVGAANPRSCIATHTKSFDLIRKLFAEIPAAQARGCTAKHFSFNAGSGGRCDACTGTGIVDVSMGHLSTMAMICPQCSGTRFNAETRQIKFRRKSISDVLAMTIDEAVGFFRTEPAIRKRLQPIRDVGLGYVTLGQPFSSLSGGENQRLQLASFLSASGRGPTLFLLDEPARGLHPADLETLIRVFRRLIGVGHTVVVAEHQLQLLGIADHVLDLSDGSVVFSGTPHDLLDSGQTQTAAAYRDLCHFDNQ